MGIASWKGKVVTRDDECYTPNKFVSESYRAFIRHKKLKNKKWDLDPCDSIPSRNHALHSFNIETNGLEQDWSEYESIFINPPFTLKRAFLVKAVNEINKKDTKIKLIYIIWPSHSLNQQFLFDELVRLECGFKYVLPSAKTNFIPKRKADAAKNPRLSVDTMNILIDKQSKQNGVMLLRMVKRPVNNYKLIGVISKNGYKPMTTQKKWLTKEYGPQFYINDKGVKIWK